MTSRSLGQWLGYLEQLHPSAIDMGLDRVRTVAEALGLKRPAPRVVTVTGTNGKGSTCAFIASLLSAHGLKVGVYSSPHLRRYNERVQVCGIEAEDAALCDAFTAVEAARGAVSLTYFEMGTLAAFWLFERAGLDVAVLEVGLGGRLDAVNLIDADVAVVTNIGIDHAEWLGDSRDSVAVEKAGIFRAGRPALCGDANPPRTLIDAAVERQAALVLRGVDFDLVQGTSGWSWRGKSADGRPLALGDLPPLTLPVDNAALALQAFMLLGLEWRAELIGPALALARVSGRFERRRLSWRGRSLNLILDVGHNPHAASYLAARLAQEPILGRRRAVFGLLGDKDLVGVLDALLPSVDTWAVAPLDSPRSRPASALRAELQQRGADAVAYPSVAVALEAQCEQAEPEDEILVFGSFYCVAEALDWLERHTD